MKRIISVLAVVIGVLGTTLTGISPASATIDCSTGGYTWVRNSYISTDDYRVGVDGRQYNFNLGPTAYTYEICLDVPDTTTFTVEIRIWDINTGAQRVVVDDQPGDKIFSYSPGVNSFWQVYAKVTGSNQSYVTYTWYEKQTPA